MMQATAKSAEAQMLAWRAATAALGKKNATLAMSPFTSVYVTAYSTEVLK